jgi:carbon-monoxide dehydrogenase medium subunit
VTHGSSAKVLAGGQSLVPMLRMRLASPDHLVDLTAAADPVGLRVTDAGVTAGFGVRLHDLEADPSVGRVCPLLTQTLPYIAHRSIRSRGTVAGNIAHADPASELPAVLRVLNGSVTVSGPDGERTIAAGDFFAGYFETALGPAEVVTAVHFPAVPPGHGTAFVETSRRHGDYALCGVAALAGPGMTRVGLLGVDVRPRAFDLADANGRLDAAIADAVTTLDPTDDIHATAAFRRHLAGVLTRRAVGAARERAGTSDLEAQ